MLNLWYRWIGTWPRVLKEQGSKVNLIAGSPLLATSLGLRGLLALAQDSNGSELLTLLQVDYKIVKMVC